jgi:23S rRNA pseudouridine1911/1915/1917 synthase
MSEELDFVDADPTITVVVPVDLAGGRLDRVLATLVPDVSRTRLQGLIAAGLVMVNDQIITDSAAKVTAGQRLSLVIPASIDADPTPENIPLDIVFEDEDLLVINKSAEMVVHPAVGHHTGTLVHALLYHCGATLSGVGGVKRPGIVHRLDRGTSGLMVVAKNDRAHQGLAAQLADRTLGRIYWAVTLDVPTPPIGTIDRPIGRHKTNRLKMAVGGMDDRAAQTHYRVLERLLAGGAALVECRLATGRTHQIRVHLASLGHPLLGDPLYGPQGTALAARLKRQGIEGQAHRVVMDFGRQALHAHEIHFNHPRTGERMSFTAPPPADFAGLMAALSQ